MTNAFLSHPSRDLRISISLLMRWRIVSTKKHRDPERDTAFKMLLVDYIYQRRKVKEDLSFRTTYELQGNAVQIVI